MPQKYAIRVSIIHKKKAPPGDSAFQNIQSKNYFLPFAGAFAAFAASWAAFIAAREIFT